MLDTDKCVFCDIVSGSEEAKVVWQNDSFIAIKNKYPVAPVHLLVLPKKHVSKLRLIDEMGTGFWDEMMAAVFAVVVDQGLNKSGYKLVNNGAGYNHFDHEHVHVLGGTKGEPAGQT